MKLSNLRKKQQPRWGAANVVDDLDMFVTTWNMHGCKVPNEVRLKEWIPDDYDVYVVALQECKRLKAMRKAMLARVGGAKEYRTFVHFMGHKGHGFPGQ